MYFTHPQFHKFPLRIFFRKFPEADFKNKLAKVFPNYHILFTDSGRSAFKLAIETLNLKNSEMIMPAYICDIFESILKEYNIKPIYLDINLKAFLVDLSDIESRITPQTKSILICHTYGLLVDLDKVLKIAAKYNLKIIEDCAHVAPPISPEKYGDALFFSFAKVFPVIGGGMLVAKKTMEINLPKYKSKLSNLIKFLRLFPTLARMTELLREIQSASVASDATTANKEEIQGASKGTLRIVNYYLDNLKTNLDSRIKSAKYFQERLTKIGFNVQEPNNNTFTYLSALVPKNINRDELFNKLRKKHIFCSRIWHDPLFDKLLNTSEASKRIINFPLQNWFMEKDIDKIIFCILSSMS